VAPVKSNLTRPAILNMAAWYNEGGGIIDRRILR
jgi:hypothetical protein